MGGFDQSAFIIAGTAIAIAGVGLYIWDTRSSALFSSQQPAAPQYNQYRDSGSWIQGGKRSRKNGRKSGNSKTKRH